jgi:ABC-type uncharacterized transport system auxiliary subunit
MKVAMRRIQQAAVICILAGVTAACSASRPVKYYVLDTGPTPSSASAQIPVTLLVARIGTSHLYRDDRLVYGSGPVQLGTYEYERWAESPADMMQEKLVAYLRASGMYRAVMPVSSSMRADYIVRGHLYALDEVDGPELAARFSFQLELFDPKAEVVVWSSTYTHDEPLPGKGKKVPDVIEALDHNVSAGLTQLTGQLTQYVQSHPPTTTAQQ